MIVLLPYFMLFFLFLSFTEEANATRLYQESGIFPNHSVEFVRTQNRNASISVDAAYYNPAGLVFMEKTGLSIMYSNQTYNVRKEHTLDYYAIKAGDYETVQTYHTRKSFTGSLPDYYYAETVAPALPDIYVAYRDRTGGRDWAVYCHFGIMQGASDTFFPRGLAIIDWGNLAAQESQLAMADPEISTSVFNSFSSDAEATRNERFIGCAAGGAYRFLDWMSAAVGIRYIYYSGNMHIRVKNIMYVVNGVIDKDPDYNWHIDTDYKGHGASVIFGLHFNPLDALNIGFKYEYHTPAEIVKKTNHLKVNPLIEASGNLDIYKDGSSGDEMEYSAGNGKRTFTLQYPMQFDLGISYAVLDNLKIEASGEITLRRLRDMDGKENAYKDIGYRLGACIEWCFVKNVCISAGYCYNDFGISEGKRDEADSLLPSHTVGGGLGFRVTDRFDLNIGASYEYFMQRKVYYTEYSNVSMPIYHYLSKTFNEYRISVAIGLTYRFLGKELEDKKTESAKMDLKAQESP
ncbi:MAG TPA: hypothetical protein P5295_18050 [Spirochaetota bacterium]|nr:hypothetical protein [Spirochaetota bacterium]